MRDTIIAITVMLGFAAGPAVGQTLVVPTTNEVVAGNSFYPQSATGNGAAVDPSRDYVAVARYFPQATNINGFTSNVLVPNYGYLPISSLLQQIPMGPYSIQGTTYNSIAGAFTAVDTAITGIRNQLASYETQMARGFAATAALPPVMTPSAPGKTTVSLNAGFYRGETGIGISVAHRLPISVPIVASASFAGSGNAMLGRVGAAIEF